MLRAVAVASPGTMKAAGTYTMLKADVPSSKYSTPACRAVALIEFMSSLRELVAGIRSAIVRASRDEPPHEHVGPPSFSGLSTVGRASPLHNHCHWRRTEIAINLRFELDHRCPDESFCRPAGTSAEVTFWQASARRDAGGGDHPVTCMGSGDRLCLKERARRFLDAVGILARAHPCRASRTPARP